MLVQTNGNGWECKRCTYINDNEHGLICELCRSKRELVDNDWKMVEMYESKSVQLTNSITEQKLSNNINCNQNNDDHKYDVLPNIKLNNELDDVQLVQWYSVDDGYSKELILNLSKKSSKSPSKTTQVLNSVGTVCSMIPSAITKGKIITPAAATAGIFTASIFAIELAGNITQWNRGKISKNQLKMRTIKSVTTNGSILAFSVVGTAIGTSIVPVVGTIIGSIIGSIIGVGASLICNKKWDKLFKKIYPNEFKKLDKKIGNDPFKIIKEAATIFGFTEKHLDDETIFNVESIKRRFKLNVREYHPDHFGRHDLFIEFYTSYKILLDHAKDKENEWIDSFDIVDSSTVDVKEIDL